MTAVQRRLVILTTDVAELSEIIDEIRCDIREIKFETRQTRLDVRLLAQAVDKLTNVVCEHKTRAEDFYYAVKTHISLVNRHIEEVQLQLRQLRNAS